jgi:hypothetical protein
MIRKALFVLLVPVLLLNACSNDAKGPDVSGIKVNLAVQRFEKDFFAVDTNNLLPSLQQLQAKYPGFYNDFMGEILGLPPVSDTSTQVLNAIKRFISDYRPLKDSADKTFGDISKITAEITKGLQHVRYYFPQYKTPEKLITFIGPMDAYAIAPLGIYSDIITTDGLATGLQLHFGSQFSFYHSPMGQALYPAYITRRFAPEYIPVNCIKNVLDDIYPEKINGKTLVEQMIEKGKRLYVLDKLMPSTADTLKIGYTKKQLDLCYRNEGGIWNFFLTNNLLLSKDPSIQNSYMADAPGTQGFDASAPGYIGLFVGWQIVKKYVEKNKELTPLQLLQTDSRKIFDEAKYKPK